MWETHRMLGKELADELERVGARPAVGGSGTRPSRLALVTTSRIDECRRWVRGRFRRGQFLVPESQSKREE